MTERAEEGVSSHTILHDFEHGGIMNYEVSSYRQVPYASPPRRSRWPLAFTTFLIGIVMGIGVVVLLSPLATLPPPASPLSVSASSFDPLLCRARFANWLTRGEWLAKAEPERWKSLVASLGKECLKGEHHD